MVEALKHFFKQFSFLGVKEIASLVQLCEFKQIKQGTILVNAGDYNYNTFVVLKGLLRNYIIKHNGEERTTLFASEGMMTSSPNTFFKDLPSNEGVMALEDCWIAYFDMRKFEKLARENLKLQRLFTEALKLNFVEAITRLEYHTTMSPEERYEHFRYHHPNLLQRVPQIYLASYLGITPVSLSRVRARLAKKK